MTAPQDYYFSPKSSRLSLLADRETLLRPRPVNQTTPSSIMKTIVCAIAVLLSIAASPASIIVDPWVPIFKGIDHATGQMIPDGIDLQLQAVNAMRIDLHDPDLQMFSDPPCTNCPFGYETLGLTTSGFLKAYGVQAAVNANFSSSFCGATNGTPKHVIGLSIVKGSEGSYKENLRGSS